MVALAASAALALVASAALALVASAAHGFEFFDGRLDIHGFYEAQLRTIARDFQANDDWDLTQWYNVLSLEIEGDVAPSGWGPFDLISTFGRIDVRYDCVWNRACGMFSSADAFGNRSGRLPRRVTDGRRGGLNGHLPSLIQRTDGSIAGPDFRLYTGIPRAHLATRSLLDFGLTRGPRIASPFYDVPGITTFFGIRGVDALLENVAPQKVGTIAGGNVDNVGGDDPAFVAFADFTGDKCRYGIQRLNGSNNGTGTRTLPWDPKCIIHPNALNANKPNPFRGPTTVDRRVTAGADGIIGTPDDVPVDPGTFGTRVARSDIDPTLPTIANPLGGADLVVAGDGNIVLGYELEEQPNDPATPGSTFLVRSDPDINTTIEAGNPPAAALTRDGFVSANGFSAGFGELPLRPAPLFASPYLAEAIPGFDADARTDPGPDGQFGTGDDSSIRFNGANARGIWLPNPRLARKLQKDRFDAFDQNFRQAELEWNRGASQQDQKELKELYADLELFDSRLWIRAGYQQIVWGKTELFRTTDQFNPQDFALSSLPSLEESRIALWALRGVYSFYDVGPLEDVRVELAMNFDQFEPADLGRCGEPYTPLLVCDKTFGLQAHGITGVALAGEQRPPDPWESWEGIEVGARIEWRWDRFSFALTDFYGFHDTPYTDQLFVYERSVDPTTGRPRKAFGTGSCSGDVFGGVRGIPATTPYEGDCLTVVNALTENPVNQTIFHLICASSIGFTNLDTTVCGQSVFNSFALLLASPLPASDPTSELTIASALGNIMVGNPSVKAIASVPILGGPQFPNAIVTLNRDPCDGFLSDCATRADGPGEINQPHAGYGGANPVPFATINNALTAQQKALLGCGEFYGTNCELEGVDLMNAEASVIMQAFTGIEGTGIDGIDAGLPPGAQGNPFRNFAAPGTYVQDSVSNLTGVGFGSIAYFDDIANGNGDGILTPNERRPIGTRALGRGLTILPGARGANRLDDASDDDPGYDPRVDGCSGPVGTDCAAGRTDGEGNPLPTAGVLRNPFAGRDPGPNGVLNFTAGTDDFYRLPDGSIARNAAGGIARLPAESPYIFVSELAALSWNFQNTVIGLSFASNEDLLLERRYQELDIVASTSLQIDVDAQDDGIIPGLQNAAGCGVGPNPPCVDPNEGNALLDIYVARTEQSDDGIMAGFQNTPGCLANPSSCVDPFEGDGQNQFFDFRSESDIDSTDFDPNALLAAYTNVDSGPYRTDGCSFARPIQCDAHSAFWAITGVQRATQRAGSVSSRYGRRDFLWHGGSEAVLKYPKRNVLGLSMDVAEDLTKTNWSFEFTWINDLPFTDNDQLDGISNADTLNLTVSVDRPTFINFLNANHTFFLNSQWFFEHVVGYNKGFPSTGPWNTLATFTVFTGYFQDRLNPSMTYVYDFRSNSMAFLPSISYRFTEVFSAEFGLAFFAGREQVTETPVVPFILPDRVGTHANSSFAENGLAVVRERDEIFLRIKYTF